MSAIPALPYAPDDALRITGGGCNTRIALMYRDGGNNKFFDAIILAGALSQLELDAMVSVMRDGEFFLPESVGLPSLTPTDAYDEDLDHPWHTFTEVTLTDEPPLRPEATLAALLAAWPSAAGSWDAAAWA